jgi:hypothetical protein
MQITTHAGLVVAAAAAGLVLATARPAQATELDRACKALAEQGGAHCALERDSREGTWQLVTSLLVGGGEKSQVVAVEHRFCDEAESRGVRGHVVRWNRMPGPGLLSAKLEWSCGANAVSSGPPR